MLRPGFLLLSLLGACIQVPELDDAVPDWVEQADYPDLIPLDGLMSETPPEQQAARLEDSLTARSDGLKSRAKTLQRPVIDDETRARMQAGVHP